MIEARDEKGDRAVTHNPRTTQPLVLATGVTRPYPTSSQRKVRREMTNRTGETGRGFPPYVVHLSPFSRSLRHYASGSVPSGHSRKERNVR